MSGTLMKQRTAQSQLYPGNAYNPSYHSVPHHDSSYPPILRPNPAPLQPGSARPTPTVIPYTPPNHQNQFSISSASTATAYRYDEDATFILGGQGQTDSPKPWQSQLSPDSGRTGFTYGSGPNMQHVHELRTDDPNRWSFDTVYSRPQGLKRFTVAWLRWHWHVQISRRRLPRLLYILCGVMLMIGWMTITLSFTNRFRASEAKNSAAGSINGNTPLPRGYDNDTFGFMSGQLVSFDPMKRMLNIDWTMFAAKGPLDYSDLTATQIPIDDWGRETFVLFRDTVARIDYETNITEYTQFRIINPNIKPVGFLGLTEFDTINTDIGMGQKSTDPWRSPEFGYPFDVYQGTITWVIASNDTITATQRPGSGVFALRGAILTDSLLNFKVRSNVTATCFIQTDPGCELIIQLRVQRTGLVKFCVLTVFLVNWIVTISIFCVTGEALLLNRTNILSGTDILAICFSALFALPSVRSLLPGVPGYGCLLDMLGILPNVIIVALCATFFANSRLRMRVHNQRERQSRRGY